MINVTKNVFKSFEVEGKEGTIRVNEGDKITFCLDSGEFRTGVITKLSGKGEKTKIQILPENASCEEVWSVLVIAEGSLEVIK
jgi:translation initiation factor IF-1